MEDGSIRITISGPSFTPRTSIMAELAVALSTLGYEVDIETGELTASEAAKLCFSKQERDSNTRHFRSIGQRILIKEELTPRPEDLPEQAQGGE